MKGPLLQMVQPILQIIAASKGIPMNEYLMRQGYEDFFVRCPFNSKLLKFACISNVWVWFDNVCIHDLMLTVMPLLRLHR